MLGGEVRREMEWVAAVIRDLTRASTVVICQGGSILFGAGQVFSDEGKKDCGAVVERVMKENKALYVEDTATLPKEVGIPFLGGRAHSVFLQPMLHGTAVLVTAASRQRDDDEPTLTRSDRAWISQMARNVEFSLQVHKPSGTESSTPGR